MNNQDFLDFNEDAFDEVNALLGEPFIYLGVTYRGVINSLETSSALNSEYAGLLETVATIINVPKTVLTVTPLAGKKVTIGNREVRIEKVTSDFFSWDLVCISDAL